MVAERGGKYLHLNTCSIPPFRCFFHVTPSSVWPSARRGEVRHDREDRRRLDRGHRLDRAHARIAAAWIAPTRGSPPRAASSTGSRSPKPPPPRVAPCADEPVAAASSTRRATLNI